MTKYSARLWFTFALWLVSAMVWADASTYAGRIDTNELYSGQPLTADLQYLEDIQGRFSLEEANQQQWRLMPSSSPTFGYTHSVYWFRINLYHSGQEALTRLLEVAYPVLDHVTLYHRINGQAWQESELGDKLPFTQRQIQHRDFVIPIDLEPQSLHELVFRVETSSSMQFPLTIWEPQNFFEHDQTKVLGMGLYYGIMLVMVFYNLFVFFATREVNYLYYVCYVACMALFLASLQGLSFQYFWPEATQWNDNNIVFFLGAAILFGILFTRNFLQIQNVFIVNFVLTLLAGFIIIEMLFSSVLSYHVMIQTIIVIAFICLNLAFGAGVIRWVQGYSTARYYTVAWFTILFGGIVLALNKFNVIPRNFFTENIVQLGSALEVILLSFALADRLNQEKRKRYIAQDLALINERKAVEAQRQALDIQRQANETLEQRVKERTAELEEANKQLEFMSITDPLTNIRNRRYFDKTMQLEMARAVREQEPISVLIVDIDYFKHVNDGYGHQVGDEALKAVAAALTQLVHRSTDLLARFGGEEFVLILPNTTIDGAAHVAECIRAAIINLTFAAPAENLKLTVSIGVYGAVPQANANYEKWITFADDALYYAKNHGRNQVVVYSSDIASTIEQNANGSHYQL